MRIGRLRIRTPSILHAQPSPKPAMPKKRPHQPFHYVSVPDRVWFGALAWGHDHGIIAYNKRVTLAAVLERLLEIASEHEACRAASEATQPPSTSLRAS